MNADGLTAVGISGSPSAHSRSRALLCVALARIETRGVATALIDLAALPSDGLLGRRRAPDVERALETVAQATIVVASTPVYRATYSGLLKVFFDLLPPHGLSGKVGVGVATGAAPGHELILDHGLAPLFASVGALVVPAGVYGTDADFRDGVPEATLLERIERAADAAVALTELSRQLSRSSIPT